MFVRDLYSNYKVSLLVVKMSVFIRKNSGKNVEELC